MTFGIGSPGFDPFWCPPCPSGSVCNTMCFDPIDGPILLVGVAGVIGLVSYGIRKSGFAEEADF